MLIYSYLIFLIVLIFIILIVRSIVLRKNIIPGKLFAEALQKENSGHFEDAIINYQNALDETKKIRFNTNTQKNKIIEKLKILHSVLRYRNGFYPGR
jgi:hypothetical protein